MLLWNLHICLIRTYIHEIDFKATYTNAKLTFKVQSPNFHVRIAKQIWLHVVVPVGQLLAPSSGLFWNLNTFETIFL